MVNEKEKSKPKRKWHVFTWLVLLVVAGCLVAMNARGVPEDSSLGFFWSQSSKSINALEPACSFQHGWPLTWLNSDTHRVEDDSRFGPEFGDVFTSFGSHRYESRWLFSVFPTSVQWFAIVVNLLVALSILILVFLVCRYRSRRNRIFKVSLAEIGILILVASFALANFQKHHSVSRNENEFLQSAGSRTASARFRYRGPSFLRSLVGEPQWTDSYRHIDRLTIEPRRVDDRLTDLLETFSWIEEVQIVGDPNVKHMAALSKLKLLKSIDVTDGGPWFLGDAKSTPIPSALALEIALEKALNEGRSQSSRTRQGELHQDRIVKPDFIFSAVEELNIDSTSAAETNWPRAVDFVKQCPNLKKVSLVGKQYLADDLLGLPSDIEEIEFGFVTSPELDFLRQQYPNAKVKSSPKVSMVRQIRHRWQIAEKKVNRRRKCGWEDSKFRKGNLDLSQTDLDRKFLQEIHFVFSEVEKLIFGNFDSSETALWLVQQCTDVRMIDAKTTVVPFEDVMQWRESIYWLELEQGSITASQFADAVKHLGLSRLKIEASDFDKDEVELIQAANPNCNLIVESESLVSSNQEDD